MFEYEVMQTLLGHLERLTDPQLRGLAITAAETALSRELKDLRFGEGVKTILSPAAPKKAEPVPAPRQSAAGPLFLEEDFYSMTRIGEKAGNYSARSAGIAANIYGDRCGYTPEQLRTTQLSINQIEMRPDTSTGKKRLMVRFSKSFSNEVIKELRTNPAFQPMTVTRGVSTLPGFDAGSQPLLSRGPFDEETTSRHS